MRVAALCLTLAAIAASPTVEAGNARGSIGAAHPGDTPLQAKCRSEAALVGGGYGKGAAQRALDTRELRRNHFKTCMQNG